MTTGRGFGKIILFGEHFVVYGLPGIASGVDKYVQVNIDQTKQNDILFKDKIFKEIISKKESPAHVLSKLFDSIFYDLNIEAVQITISGDCLPASGMGYSAALCVALARAINNYLKLGWTDEKVNEIAYRGECFNHGRPSGIDNACATYGALIYFQKDVTTEKSKFHRFKPLRPLRLVLADTGIRHNTKEAVEMVRKNKEINPKLFEKYFADEKLIISKARNALKNGNLKKLGALMNENQELLINIGVSSKEIERLTKIALENNALGAKLTGAGCGGMVISLFNNDEEQKEMTKIYKKHGINAIKIIIK